MKNPFATVVTLSLVVLGGLILLLNWSTIASALFGGRSGKLVFYCAAGLREPVTEIADQYEDEYGVKVELIFKGSGDLLGMLETADKGDLYLAASQQYIDDARNNTTGGEPNPLVAEDLDIGRQHVVIVVKKGNASIRRLEDLTRDDVRLVLADPEAAAISRAARKMLARAGQAPLWDRLWKTRKAEVGTVNEVANLIKADGADAGLVWDATARQYPELELVTVPVFQKNPKRIKVAVLTSTQQPPAALHFARYLTAKDRGLKVFRERGYETIEGDAWADKPKLVFFAGSVTRKVVEPIVDEFARREGVQVEDDYNGCGILVAKMKAGSMPDLYFSCDTKFMDMVAERYERPRDAVATDIVLICRKGQREKKNIRGLTDLLREDLRTGVCAKDNSALGFLTVELFKSPRYRKLGLWPAAYDNASTQADTGDVLVAQVVTGGLDLAVVYRANAAQQQHALEVIEIEGQPNATQPIAVAQSSQYKHLAGRLMQKILDAENRKLFLSAGFDRAKSAQPISVWCDAALRPVAEAAAAAFEKRTGIAIKFTFGPPGELLRRAQVEKSGDVLLVADRPYAVAAQRKNLVEGDIADLARQYAVLAVAKDSSRNFDSLQAALDSGAALSLGDSRTADVSAYVERILREQDQRQLWQDLLARASLRSTARQAADDVNAGLADAALVWQSTLTGYPDLEGGRVKELAEHPRTVSAVVLRSSGQPAAARRFVGFLSSPEGAALFEKQAYEGVGEQGVPRPDAAAREKAPIESRHSRAGGNPESTTTGKASGAQPSALRPWLSPPATPAGAS